MSYALRLEQTHKLAYSGNVMMVAQQMQNHLAGAVTEIAASGEAMKVSDIFGKVRAQRGEQRTRRNIENPVDATARWLVFPDEIKTGQYLDKEDQLKSIMDPTSTIVRTHTAAVIRMYQEVVIGAEMSTGGALVIGGGGILGRTYTGKQPGAAAALPDAQFIAANATGLTMDKLRAAVLKLQLADFGIEQDDPLYAVITPKQKDDLLGIAEQTKTSLNAFSIQQLETGKPTMLMGINWILSNTVPLKAAGGPRVVPVFSKKNIVAGIWEPIRGEAWNDTHADNKPYVKVSCRLDVTRLEDKGVVAIECAE